MHGTNLSPKLSIGLPVYNGERFLPQALSCLLGQTFGDFEFIICDNASTDETQQICLDHATRDRRIRYVRNERNLGANANFNRTASLSRAPYFKWVAHDDLYDPAYLAACVKILDNDPDIVLAHSATAFIDNDGREFPWEDAANAYIDPRTSVRLHPDDVDIGSNRNPASRFWQVLSRALWGSHMFGVIRRPILLRTHLLENYVSSDRAMLGELALLGRFESSPERLFKKRIHPQGSWALDQKELREFLSTSDKSYSRRTRQLRAFFAATSNKQLALTEKALCTGMVGMHCMKVLGKVLLRNDARNAKKGRILQKGKASP
jgi:glycosyltransferase involved in cell wall biosynthesis